MPSAGRRPRRARSLARRREAIADHDDIREIISGTRLQDPGSAPRWRAVQAALAATAAHLDREEAGVLAECLPRMPQDQRRMLGRQWTGFTAAWAPDATP